MYMKKMIEVGKAENGYVVEVRVPFKPKKKNDEIDCYRTAEKQYVADDSKGVAALIEKIMPMLDEDFTSEDEFDQAFKTAAKVI